MQHFLRLLSSVLLLLLAASAESSPSDHEERDLAVSINVTYSPSSSFHGQPPHYQAGSAITLTCQVEGVTDHNGVYFVDFAWNSDCKGARCFALGSSSQSVSKLYLESKDTGTYTCIVHDALGCSGNANTTIKVVGAGIYVTQNHQSLPNDGLIVATSNRISEFRCLSGTTLHNVGQFIGTSGVDIVTNSSDPFHITRGNVFNPGVIHVRSHGFLTPENEGIYTCKMPDEMGAQQSVNVGLYLSGVKPPTVTDVIVSVEDTLYTLTCISTGSPATEVFWSFNNAPLSASNGTHYETSKILTDRKTSSYFSVLTVNGSLEDIVGEYSCQVSNQLGQSNTVTREIKGLYITGYETPILVGLQRTINCSTLLNVSKMEWLLVGISEDPVEQTSDLQYLPLKLTPTDIALNGAMFTCRTVTEGGNVFEETITIHIKELANIVTITGDDPPLLAGRAYTLTCTVESDITPSLRWMDGQRNDITGNDSHLLEGPIPTGLLTVYTLTFPHLQTSQGGVYYCESTIEDPSSVKEASREIRVKIPRATVSILKSPNDSLLYTTSQLNITCTVEVVGVDNSTEVDVNSTWTGPATTNTTDMLDNQTFESTLTIASLQSTHSGTYTCTFIVFSESPFVDKSDEVSATTTIQAALKVSIAVTYTSPDQYPVYRPPNFRAASSVTLRCVAEGASGSVRYRWSSTCRSCFASNSYQATISESFLRSRDSGTHTCTASDSASNTGSQSQHMNITGAGIYVVTADRYGGTSANDQPNNTYVDYISSPSPDRQYFALYCCSGATNRYVGSIVNPYVRGYSSGYDGIYDISRYDSYSEYAGCIRFQATRRCSSSSREYNRYSGYRYVCHSYYSGPTSGLYTCTLPDEKGVVQEVGFALLSSVTYPRISSFIRLQHTGSVLTLSCVTTSAPPTDITWTRDGHTISIDGVNHRLVQIVTSRTSIIYSNRLEIFTHPDNFTGRYGCSVDNNHYYSTRSSYVSINGIQVSGAHLSSLHIGQPASFTCSSDLDPTNVTWYDHQNGTVFSNSQLSFTPVSTDDEGKVFTCETVTPYGTQERNVTINTYVPNDWLSMEITGHQDRAALHGSDYTLACHVVLIEGLTLPVTIEWLYSNGSVLASDRLLVTRVKNSSLIATLLLKFSPILTSDGGGYTCRASVTVPWMAEQPPTIQASVHIPVTTQALLQLKMGPVKHCVDWTDDQTFELEGDIKQSIESAVREKCNCVFESSAIYSGEFSCQTTTTHVVYRAIINGTSDILPSPVLMNLIESWREKSGTLLYGKFRLRLASSKECPLRIESFDDLECKLPASEAFCSAESKEECDKEEKL